MTDTDTDAGPTHDLASSPRGTVHAIHNTLRYRTVCGSLISDDWEEEERDYHPSFCKNCKQLLTQ